MDNRVRQTGNADDRRVDIYLASQSPRRRELLQQIGVSFERLPVDIDEGRLTD